MERLSPTTTRVDPSTHEKFHRESKGLPVISVHSKQHPLIISSNVSKSERRSGGSWIIALECGTHIVQGYTPNFGQISAINSYRVEVYASLAATLFLHLYPGYYKFSVHNTIHDLCEDRA